MHEPCQKRYTWITNFLFKTERFNTQDWRAHILFCIIVFFSLSICLLSLYLNIVIDFEFSTIHSQLRVHALSTLLHCVFC